MNKDNERADELHFNSKHTDDELLKIMRDYSCEEFPTIRKFTAGNGLPTARVYIDRFGSLQEAIRLSGIEIPEDRKRFFNREEYSDERLLSQLKDFAEHNIDVNNRLPSLADIRRNKSIPSLSVYYRRFGGIEDMYRRLGYDFHGFNQMRVREEMANRYIEISKTIGRTPTSRDIDEYSKRGLCKSAHTYMRHFGGIRKLQEFCGLSPTVYGKGRSEEDLIRDLIRLRDEIGRVPTQHDLDERDDMASSSTYRIRFGSLPKSLEMAGMSSDRRAVHTTKNGTPCYSRLETLFSQMLERYGFDFVKDSPYAEWIDGFDSRHTFDFVVFHNDVPNFVEVFGILGNKKYDETKEFKREVCKSSGIDLIEITMESFWSKTQNELYHDFISQLNEGERSDICR